MEKSRFILKYMSYPIISLQEEASQKFLKPSGKAHVHVIFVYLHHFFKPGLPNLNIQPLRLLSQAIEGEI